MRTLILLLALPLAACGGGSGNSTATASPTAPAGLSPTQQQIVDLPEEQRKGVFIRALRDANIDCQGVTKTERRTDIAQDGQPTWIATCQGGATYSVSITPDGTAMIVGDGTVGRRT